MRSSSGFSLIELLVVMVILAVVSVAVLAAIQPLEQIRKAHDAAKLKDAAELLSGYGKYLGSFKCYPWYPGAPDCTSDSDSRLYTATVPDFSKTGVDYQLVSQGLLKEVFIRRRSIENYQMLVSTDGEQRVHICFEPESQKGRSGALLGLRDNINQTNQSCADPKGYPDDSCFVCVTF